MEPWHEIAGASTGRSRESSPSERDVWITGIGLTSSLGCGHAQHWEALSAGSARPNVDTSTYAPYTVHPLAEVSLESQIPSKADLRQMGRWQQIGVHAAGLALDDAALKGDAERLSSTDLVVAAGNGERDAVADAAVLKSLASLGAEPRSLISALQASLRPTLYLGELTNLLAGNISIVHGVTRSSRTFKGEEQAGVAAFRDAVLRVQEGTSHLALVGGACNAERDDLHLSLELCSSIWRGDFATIRRRSAAAGGIIPGSIGSFVVLEDADHARGRGVRPYARVTAVTVARSDLALPHAARSLAHTPESAPASHLMRVVSSAPIDVLSGASGVRSAMEREMRWLDDLARATTVRCMRFHGDAVGHGIEAHFLTGIALAATALGRGEFYPPFADDDDRTVPAGSAGSRRTLVTGFGHWRGAGAALLEAVEVGQ